MKCDYNILISIENKITLKIIKRAMYLVIATPTFQF